jgi:hypothetical protein
MAHKHPSFFRKVRYLLLGAVLALGLIAVIGSGGDDDSTASVDLDSIGGTIYNGAQSIGDLFQVAFNPTTLNYMAVVIEGDEEGESETGTLSPMAGYTQYVYETADHVPVIIFPDNVFIAIPGGGDEGLMVGVPSLAGNYTAADIAGVYNFVQFAGTAGDIANYEGSYGTFKVDAGGTWEVSDGGDLGATIPPVPDDSGTWVDQGNGIIYAYSGGNKVANVMIHPSYAGNDTEQVLIIDINDGTDRGIMLGVMQQPIDQGDVDGTYALLESDEEELFEVEISGTDAITPDGTGTLTYNSPWNGFVEVEDGSLVLMLPGGILFGGGEESGDFWIFAGIRQ